MYEAKWEEGGSISYLYAYTDLLVNKESNDTASEFVREQDPRHRQGSEDGRAAVRPTIIRSAPSG